jgi:hypothetical protein
VTGEQRAAQGIAGDGEEIRRAEELEEGAFHARRGFKFK